MLSSAITSLLKYLHEQPFILLFLVVGVGYLLGRFKYKSVTLGATASTLLLALGLSVYASATRGFVFEIPNFASTLFFNLFMFAVGVKVGPQFLSGLRKDARYFITLGLVTPLLAIALTLLVDRLFKLPPGVAVGVLGGANTATPGLGAATDALRSGAARLPEGTDVAALVGTVSTAFAFTYCVSTIGFILMMKVLPRMFKRDAVADAKRFEKETAGDSAGPLPGTADQFFVRASASDVRTYRLMAELLIGKTAAEVRLSHPRVALERVRRNGVIIESLETLRLQRDDIVALAGPTERLVQLEELGLGMEVSDPELRDVGRETADLIIRNKQYVGKKLKDLAGAGYGLFLNAMYRGGEQVPYGPDTVVEKGDVLVVTGSKRRIESLGHEFGRVVVSSLSTDIVTLSLGMGVGAAIGAFSVPIAGIRFSLGSAVGLLLTGIALSIVRTRNPAFGGPFPEPARQLLEDLGLNVFIAILGLNSGKSVIEAVQGSSLTPVVLSALIVGFIPPIIAWAIGQLRFKMNSALLMGAVAGARCNSAGMRASQEETQSTVPAISYPVTFAISNIVLTLACYMFAIFSP